MKILFTKNIDPAVLSSQLRKDISFDCIEVIKATPIRVSPFDLKNFSLIFTSVNGVDSFFQNQFKPNEDFTSRCFNKIYCVGEKTKKRLRKYGFGTFKVLPNAEALSQFIVGNCQHEKFIHFCGNLALDVLHRDLPLQNIRYKKITVYHTEELNPVIHEKYNAIVFFSPSGVRSFVRHNSLDGMTIFSIGKTTSKEIKNYTQRVIFTCKDNNLMSILMLIRNHYKD